MQLEFDFWNDEVVLAYVEFLALRYRILRFSDSVLRFRFLCKLAKLDDYRRSACPDGFGFDWKMR